MIVREVFKVVASAREEGISILLVEQNVRAATEIADRAYVLDNGRVVFSGPAGKSPRTRIASAHWPAPALKAGPRPKRISYFLG